MNRFKPLRDSWLKRFGMKSFRVLHITHSLNVGGLERVVVDLTKGFRENGHIVGICCLDGKGVLGEAAEKTGISVISLNKRPGLVWQLPFRIAKVIKQGDFDIVHTHNESGLVYGATAAVIARASRLFHTEHGKEPEYLNKKALQSVERLLLRRTNRVVTVSEDLRRRMVNSSGLNDERIVTIRNGIDVEEFFHPEYRNEIRESLGIRTGSFLIGNIARLVSLKNHRFLLDVFSILLKECRQVRLVLVGDGPLREDLEDYAKKMGVWDSVLFLGERKDVPNLLAAFDLFVLPSLTEGLSITLLEAMASGTPVVASDVGGNPEIVEKGETGLLLPLGNTGEWIRCIKCLIEDPDKRKKFSERARVRVNKEFSLFAMVERYEEIYKF